MNIGIPSWKRKKIPSFIGMIQIMTEHLACGLTVEERGASVIWSRTKLHTRTIHNSRWPFHHPLSKSIHKDIKPKGWRYQNASHLKRKSIEYPDNTSPRVFNNKYQNSSISINSNQPPRLRGLSPIFSSIFHPKPLQSLKNIS